MQVMTTLFHMTYQCILLQINSFIGNTIIIVIITSLNVTFFNNETGVRL